MNHRQATSLTPGERSNMRSRRLIKPDLQWRLIGGFVAITAIAFLLQAAYLISEMAAMATNLSIGGSVLQEAIPGLAWKSLAVSFLVLLPLTVAVGVLITFRLAGPMYRFEQWLGAIARGEDPGPCKIRRGDQLQDFCEVLNQAVDRLRAERGEREATQETEEPVREVA